MSNSKYLPYGETKITIPYLVRRAVETQEMLSSSKDQIDIIKYELRSRAKGT
jgi:hypothetical protein